MLSMAKKAEIFQSKLSQQDLNTLAYIVKLDRDKEVNARVDREVYTINQALQTSIAAALFDFTELSIAEVEDILTRSNEYMKGAEDFLIKYGEDWIMKINEIKPKIKEECLKLLNQNKNQADAVKILSEKFKEVPTKDRVNIFKETKEEWCKICPTIDKEKKGKSEEMESSNTNIPKKENESNMEPTGKYKEGTNMFEVVEKKVKFKGKYYDYEKDKNGLKVGCEFFKSLEEIETFRKREAEEFEKMIAEVRAAYNFEG